MTTIHWNDEIVSVLIEQCSAAEHCSAGNANTFYSTLSKHGIKVIIKDAMIYYNVPDKLLVDAVVGFKI